MFYKIPKNANLSKTSFRCRKDTDDYIYIEYNSGFVGDDWVEISEETLISELGTDPFNEIVEPEPTEQELIQAEILLNQADILAKQNELDAVLAEILLNQMGV